MFRESKGKGFGSNLGKLRKGRNFNKIDRMQDGLVKKGDQDVDFQEFNEKKVQFPMNFTYDGTEELGVFENALRAYKDLYRIKKKNI